MENGCCAQQLFYVLNAGAMRNFAALSWVMQVPAGIALFMLVIKMSYFAGAPAFPFMVAAAPLIVQMGIVIVASATGTMFDWDDDFVYERFVTVGLAAVWCAAVVMLALKFDGYIDVNWYQVLAPSFLTVNWLPMYALLSPVLSVSPCCNDCMEDNSYWNRYDEPCSKFPYAVPPTLFIALPLNLFLWLIAANAEHDRFDSFAIQFVPVHLLLCAAVLAWLARRIYLAFH